MKKEEAISYLQKLYPNGGHCWLDEQRIEAISMAINALQEEPVSEGLEEASKNHASERYRTTRDRELAEKCKWSFKAGAKWQEKQDQSIIELAEDHAMLAGMEKMKEQMMAKAVEAKVTARWPLHSSPLYYSYEIYVPYAQHLSEGDNVKILIIKKEDN